MRISDAKALVGKIVTLDLIGGVRLTTKVETMDKDPKAGQFYLHCGRLLVFLIEHRQKSPTGKMSFRITGAIPYGIPEMAPQKTNVLALDHVVFAQTPIDGLAALYAKQTSSIVSAPPPG